MKRGRARRLTPAERRSILFVAAFLLVAIALGTWIHLSQNDLVPPAKGAVGYGQDLRTLRRDDAPSRRRRESSRR